MSNNEEYVSKIIQKTGLSKKEIQKRMEEKKAALKGLISDEGALFIIAKELGVEIQNNNKISSEKLEINISDVSLTMKNLTLVGRIKDIYSINNFTRKDGTLGLVGSFLLHDSTGDIRIVLWDENTKIMENDYFQKNELVKLINGYIKIGRYNEKEVHLGSRGRINLGPDDVNYKKYPEVKEKRIAIENINLNMRSITISGEISQIYQTNEFKRNNGQIGKVKSIIIADSTGITRVTFWNQDVEKLDEYNIGDCIIISNLIPRQNKLYPQKIDLHFGNTSQIKKSKESKVKNEKTAQKTLKIEELQKRQGLVNFQGIITQIDNLKKVRSKTNEEFSLLNLIIGDNTDAIRVSIWREKAENLSDTLKMGDGVLLKNVLVKFNSFSSRNEVSFTSTSEIKKIELDIQEVKSIDQSYSTQRKDSSKFSGIYTRISEINSSGIFEVKGFIAKEISNITIYNSCPVCFKKIENCTCDVKDDFVPRMILNLILDDESGTIRGSFIGERAEKVLGIKTSDLIFIRETPEFESYLKKISEKLLGKEIIIKGKCKFNDFSNNYEINVYNFKEVEPIYELKKIVKEIEN